jgi:endonuclease/exonuclease/phosphatase family metal-dependent hydrolase
VLIMLGPLVRITLGVAILIDVLRVFLPSLITIFGSAGSTPAEMIGLYALSWFLAAFLAVAGARLIGRRGAWWVAIVGAALLVAGRAALQFTDGAMPQLYLASVALLGGLWWLTATAMAPPRGFMVGLVWGFAVATGIHAALDTVDLVWRAGPLPVILMAVELLLFAGSFVGRGSAGPSTQVTAEDEMAPRAWLAVGPAVLLWGLYPGNPAHAQASDGWSPAAASVAVAVAGFVATLFATRPRLSVHPVVPTLVLVGSATAFAFGEATIDGVHGVAPWWTVVAQLAGILALGACLGWTATTRSVADRPVRRGLLLATGFVLFMVFAFAYYAAYDLGVPNDYVPILVAILLGLLAVLGSRAAELDGLRRPVVRALAGAVVAGVAVAAIAVWRPAPAVFEPPDDLRIAAYNIRMGFGLAGTFTVPAQADALRDLAPHVIVLSEVDRAWFLNGGHDDLRLIADRLGMRYLWAPAADEVWGDALLTNLPVTSVRNHPLVQGGPTGAQALEVGLEWNGKPLTVIATHLQPPSGWEPLDQVEQLAEIVRAAPKPVILAGDLNIEPGEPAWDVLIGAGLVDAFADVRPFYTTPSEEDEQIDHILISPGFASATDPANPDLPISDHRPIAVTLRPAD